MSQSNNLTSDNPLAADVETFIRFITEQKQYSPHTQTNYQRQLAKLIAYIDDMQIRDWRVLKTVQIRQLSAFYHRKGMSARSIALILSACRSFFDFLVSREKMAFNPAKGVKAPKFDRPLPKTVDVDQVNALLAGIDDGEDLGIRDKAITELFYSSGIRLAELVRLDLNDIDFQNASARIIGKGNKTRHVPIGRHALKALREWIKVRGVWLGGNDTEAVFISQRLGRLSPRSIQQRLAYWGKFVGMNGRLHPHKFRHSCATHFLESSGDLRAVQELLGHANLSTTQVYTHLDFQQLAKVYDNAHPRAKKRN